MNREPSSRYKIVEATYQRAADLPPERRTAYLAEQCAGDLELRTEVETLLEHYEMADEAFLQEPVHELASVTHFRSIPERIGPFEIVRLIGEGGMGTVFEARQENPRRNVAVKVIRPGIPSSASLRRFENEAQILGRLQHPGIAHVYEAGVADVILSPESVVRQPFFAMELVRGNTLTEFVQGAALNLEKRMELFVRICDAVEHAHQSGVIHRDLKPANILVTETGEPKILDFGVARITNSDVQVTTMHTDFAQVVGTLPYMSPEQVEQQSAQVDERSDVYALGVILYELVADRLPYDLSGMQVARAARVIAEDPPTSLATLSRVYRGDLDTIVNKVLDKEPDRRYQSVAALAADVRRYLSRQPITARPTSTVYQFRKFAQRNPALVIAFAATFVVLIGGVIATTTFALRERAEARTRRDVAQFLREMLTSVEPAKTAGEPLTVRAMLDDIAPQIGDRFKNARLVRGELHHTVGSTYFRLGAFENAEHHTRAAVADLEVMAGSNADSTLRAMSSLGLILSELDRLDEAETILREALQRLKTLDSPAAGNIRENLAIVLSDRGQYAAAERLKIDVYNRALKRLGADHPDTIRARSNLGTILFDLGRFDEALPHYTDSLKRRRAVLGDEHPHTISSIGNLGALFFEIGRLEEGAALMREAAECSERVLGRMHIKSVRRRQNLVRVELAIGNFETATAQARDLLTDGERELGPSHRESLAALELVVTAVALGGDPDRAEILAIEWYDRLNAKLGPQHKSTGRIAFLLQNFYEETGNTDQENSWRERVEASSFQPNRIEID